MKLELIRISLSSILELTYNIEVMHHYNLFEYAVLGNQKGVRVVIYTGDIDSWWDKTTMNPITKRKVIRFLNKKAMTEERRIRNGSLK